MVRKELPACPSVHLYVFQTSIDLLHDMVERLKESEVLYDVLIIGCGPVGAFLCALLSSLNVRTLVVERDVSIYPAPRAVAMDDGTMRIVSLAHPKLGIWLAGHVLHAPVDVRTGPPDVLGSFSLVGPHAPRLVSESGGLPDLSFFHQPTFENNVRNVAFGNGIDNTTICKLLAPATFSKLVSETCAQCAAGAGEGGGSPSQSPAPALPGCGGCRMRVDVDVSDLKTRSSVQERLYARYVIGADGGASSVRRGLGIGFEGSTFAASPWLVIDIETEDPVLTARWTSFNFVCDPLQPFVHVPLPGIASGRRFEFALQKDANVDEATSAGNVATILSQAGIDVSVVRVIRAVVYTFHARVATRWRQGRTFLVGDAAHCTPPFRGQGLCSGLRDAANLAWKLAAAVAADKAAGGKGNAAKRAKIPLGRRVSLNKLLDSYQIERAAHVIAVTALAVKIGRLVDVRSRPLAFIRDVIVGSVNACPLTRAYTKDPFNIPNGADEGFFTWPRAPRNRQGGMCGHGRVDVAQADTRIGRRVPNLPLIEPGAGAGRLIDDTIWYAQNQGGLPKKEVRSVTTLWTLLISPRASASVRAISAVTKGVDGAHRSAGGGAGAPAGKLFIVLQLLPASGSLARATRHSKRAGAVDLGGVSGVAAEAWWRVADIAAGDASAQLGVWFDGERSAESCAIAALVRPDGAIHSIYTCEELEGGALAQSAVVALQQRHEDAFSTSTAASPPPPLISRRPENAFHTLILFASSLVAMLVVLLSCLSFCRWLSFF